MSAIDDIIKFNSEFVAGEKYIPFAAEKFPRKKLAVVSCMDTRLTELLPAALNLKNGDANIIKTAGAVVSHPRGGVMRSILVAVYTLGVREIMIVGHTGCGMRHLDPADMALRMHERGVTADAVELEWLRGFDDETESVRASVNLVRNHPLMPRDITVRGFLMDIDTGKIIKIP